MPRQHVDSARTDGARRRRSAIPSVSIVTPQNNLTSSGTGIYVNAGNHGRSWERPASLEILDPSGCIHGSRAAVTGKVHRVHLPVSGERVGEIVEDPEFESPAVEQHERPPLAADDGVNGVGHCSRVERAPARVE